jgi:hypothetical protein
MIAAPDCGTFLTEKSVVTGASNVNAPVCVPAASVMVTTTCGLVARPLGARHRRLVVVYHEVVLHIVEPTLEVALRSIWPKFTPLSVNEAPSPEVGAFAGDGTVTAGASKEKR